MKVLVSEQIAQKGIEKLTQEGVNVDVKPGLPREELLSIIGEYDGLIVRSNTKVNEELYQKAAKLKVVGRAGNGVDNIEMEGATKRGIIVVNTPESNVVSAAELTIGLLFATCRNIPQLHNRLKERLWDRSGLKGMELQGKTVGIVGLGRIGSLVATRLKSFGMTIIAYDPYISDTRFQKLGVEKKETLDELMSQCDILTIHTPKTEETYGMIGKEQFKVAKKGLTVINCARAGLINEAALMEALKAKIVKRAGIDVLEGEPHATSPLLEFDNVIVTPHAGADTVEAQDNVGITVAQEVVSALRGEMVPNAVNLPTLPVQELDVIQAYLRLGEIMGKMYYQLEKEAVEKVEIIYQGEVASLETPVISLAILKGLFEPVLKERVNYVNAQLIAKNRSVKVTESKESTADNYLTLITLKVMSKGKVFTISGTTFAKGEPRIVEINGYEFDVNPTPYMLIAENIDKPGVVGQMGTLLGAGKVNIATMQLGRNFTDQQAMMVLAVDSEVSRETLQFLSGIEGILRVRFVKI
ncbi:phosphoglycerate dehydrogenase [Sporomusa acidovorans]|uniref:D-3-phosphoglycerate dehydrogenase n=1 Tax=Sporomusa acidovorans (strain ATCC 49682 / DSM 3132 / Mol) TaxID=1123286 RepID=A0ABZ3IW56_SPOA4|nr:phosphoglycerate dehydrogenase [Sporomusa acidovorans]OZC23599.1 D-3-phosphoglycerate dehydrogenase [Sporomusa acidovorans DSM 3132]SDE22060.1 D-3-phosphoglycerate dehydrogenase [Sporomusa acidovorans]